MPVTSVLVTGTLKMPSGLPAALATVRFTLSSPGLLGVTVVLPFTVRTTADANGVFTVNLAPNPLNSYYTVTVYRATGVVMLETVAVVPAFDCQFSQVIQTRQPSQATAAVAAIAQLQTAEANIEVVRLGVLATAAATTSSSQASLVQFQATVDQQLQAAEARIAAARLDVLATADATNSGSQASLISLQQSVNTYEALMASTQSTVEGVVDSAIGISSDLVTAYQLST